MKKRSIILESDQQEIDILNQLDELENQYQDLTEEEKKEVEDLAEKLFNEIEEQGGIENLDEGFFSNAFGTVAGWIAGPTIGKVIARALGVEKGVLYNFLTSRLAGAAIGRAISKHLSDKKIAKINVKESRQVNEAYQELPKGYFKMKETVSVGGGAWRMTFSKDSIIRYGISGDKKLESYMPVSGTWKNRVPPISGYTDFNLSNFGDEAGTKWSQDILKNALPISEKVAKDLINDMVIETVVQVRDIQKAIEKMALQPNQKVKITVVKG